MHCVCLNTENMNDNAEQRNFIVGQQQQIAEDWENSLEEQQIAQIARRQKEIQQRQTEEQQLTVSGAVNAKASNDSGFDNINSVTQIENLNM